MARFATEKWYHQPPAYAFLFGDSLVGNAMATKRKSLSKKTRFDVFKRDGFKCMYCGAHPPSVLLEVDHIVPVAGGGTNSADNLVTACEPCNRGKAAVSLDIVPQGLADKAAAVAEREEQLKGFHSVMESKRKRLDAEAWELMNMWREEQDSAPRDWMNSMRMFLDKLGYHEVRHSIEIAMAKSFYKEEKTWRYFCGICWNKLRDESNG